MRISCKDRYWCCHSAQCFLSASLASAHRQNTTPERRTKRHWYRTCHLAFRICKNGTPFCSVSAQVHGAPGAGFCHGTGKEVAWDPGCFPSATKSWCSSLLSKGSGRAVHPVAPPGREPDTSHRTSAPGTPAPMRNLTTLLAPLWLVMHGNI